MRCALCTGCVIAVVVFASQAPPAVAQVRLPLAGVGGADLTPQEIQQLFDAYALVQAQDMLELSDEQYGQFVTNLKALQGTRRESERERRRLMQRLQRLSNPNSPADETTVREQLQALRSHEIRAAEGLRNAYDAIDEVLDVRQQVRFRVFEERIERRKLELVLRASQGRPSPQRRNAPRER